MHTPISDYGRGLHHEWSIASHYAKWLSMNDFVVKVHMLKEDAYLVEAEKRDGSIRIVTNSTTINEALLQVYINAKAVQ